MSSTESASDRFATVETWSSLDLVEGIVEHQFVAIAAVHSARESIAEAIDRVAERLAGGGRIVYMGAGTSGRIATQDASELPPTFSWPYERAISLMAGGVGAFTKAQEGAEDSEEEAVAALDAAGVGNQDVVIALAASGRTPFAIAGLRQARTLGALAVGIYNNRGAPLGEVCDVPILLETGSEFLAGSTRMKAGTAQKAALNCISTGVMIRLGFVYRGLMVEMRPTNEKLHGRAVGMVATITGSDDETARAALSEAGGSIKLACVMLRRGLDRSLAQSCLDGAKGILARALDE